jgi:hypothetical protein
VDGGTNAGEGVTHQANKRAIAKANQRIGADGS